MKSIAFPAIGTGTLQFPHADVAEIYFDEVMSYSQKNPRTSIKEVRFVLYDKDDLSIQAFNTELKKRKESNAPLPARRHENSFQPPRASSPQTASFSPVRARDQDHFETYIGSLCFKVEPGDITEETTDAIVIISNEELDIQRGSGAGAAILKAGGLSIQRECSQKGPQRPGSVVVTKAGNLNARFIFHIVPTKPLDDKSIKGSVMKCLQEAERKGLSSISFPAIGTGNLGLSARDCAHTMLSVICDFSAQQPKSMQLMKMIIFQKEMMKEFRSAMEEASGQVSEKSGIIRRVVSRVGEFLGFGDSDKKTSSPSATLTEGYGKAFDLIIFAGSLIRCVVSRVGEFLGFGDSDNPTLTEGYDKAFDLIIFAGSKGDLQRTVEEINEVMKEKSEKGIIENEAITSLSEEHLRRIHTLELRYDVKASVEKEVGRIVVRGQTADILVVSGKIHNILHHVKEDEHERKQAESLSKDIQWMYKDVDTFVEYQPRVNAKIEAAYNEKKTGVNIEEGRYKIDFNSMTEKDKRGGVTEVQRLDRRGRLIWNSKRLGSFR